MGCNLRRRAGRAIESRPAHAGVSTPALTGSRIAFLETHKRLRVAVVRVVGREGAGGFLKARNSSQLSSHGFETGPGPGSLNLVDNQVEVVLLGIAAVRDERLPWVAKACARTGVSACGLQRR